MEKGDPDIRLMLAFQEGDEMALSDLYRKWAGPLRRYLERIVRERATAEELVQEAFIRVHGARERYSPEARFSTWLYRIGRNLAFIADEILTLAGVYPPCGCNGMGRRIRSRVSPADPCVCSGIGPGLCNCGDLAEIDDDVISLSAADARGRCLRRRS